MKKLTCIKIVIIFLLLIFISSPLLANKMNILVHPFKNTGNKKYSWISDGMSDTVIADLSRLRGIIVITEEDRKEAIKEIEIGQSGLVDERTAVKVGKMTGANLILIGSYSVSGKRIRIIAKLMKVETGKIEKSIKIDGTVDNIFDVQDKVVINLMAEAEKVKIANIRPVKFSKKDKQLIKATPKPKNKAYEYYSKGLKTHGTDPGKALEFYLKALKIEPEYIAALQKAGHVYRILNDFDKSTGYFFKARDILEKQGKKNTKHYAFVMGNIALGYKIKNDNDKALEYLFKAQKIIESLNLKDSNEYCFIIVNLGLVYRGKKDYDKALQYLLKCKKIKDKLGHQKTHQYAYIILQCGVTCSKKGDSDKAREYFFKAKEILDQLGLQKSGAYSGVMFNIGIEYRKKNEPDKALEYLLKAKDIFEHLKLQDTIRYAGLMMNIGIVHHKYKRNPCEGAKYVIKAVEIMESQKHPKADSSRKILRRMNRSCRRR